MNERLRILILKNKIKHFMSQLKGVKCISIKDNFDGYREIYDKIKEYYKIDSAGKVILNCIELEEHMRMLLNIDDYYYIPFENDFFIEFKFLNMRDFIKSWRVVNKGYDLTIFNKKIIFIIDYNEDNLSIHTQDLI
ncbi:hypothetical protein ACDW34_12480 [Acinetobacter piscicola]|uniref:hypothetical protein n=1 Tax=Acinetobacter piscicola TaxID=2006115 RepID=UPI003556CF2C